MLVKKNGCKQWGVRLGFIQVKSLDKEKACLIEKYRQNTQFSSMEDVLNRTNLTKADLQVLASAEVFHSMQGNRYQARWAVSGIEEVKPLFVQEQSVDALVSKPPSLENDIAMDLSTTRVNLRPHIMALLRREEPFSYCRKQADLLSMSSGSFIKVSGLVTGRQRPGTANGTLFLTLEDETGNINVVVWRRTQELFRKPLLTGKLLLVKGTVEIERTVVHVMAGQIIDYSHRLVNFESKSRDFH